MAKLERTFHGENFDRLLCRIEEGVMQGSMSATLEDSADYHAGDARCSVRVFERYSYSGSNRVSMSVTLFQAGDTIRLCAVTSGGTRPCSSRSTPGVRSPSSIPWRQSSDKERLPLLWAAVTFFEQLNTME